MAQVDIEAPRDLLSLFEDVLPIKAKWLDNVLSARPTMLEYLS